jgi:hypothetical protein
LKEQRLIKQKRRAARRAAAKRRAAGARQRSADERLAAARQVAAAWQSRSGGGGFEDRDASNVPVLALTALGAVLILSLSLVPSPDVPRSRISALLLEHRGHFTLVGGMVLLSVAVFSALTLLTK